MAAPVHAREGRGRYSRSVPSQHARKITAARAVTSLVSFLSAQRKINQAWLKQHVQARSGDVRDALRVERDRERQFARNAADRLSRDLPKALARPIRSRSYRADRRARREAIASILAREQRFAQMHAREMARRSLSSVSRGRVRRESPKGAMWLIGHAKNHTEGCLFMAGRFWPWPVLDRVHPPRHPGCTSSLIGEKDAVARGMMAPEDADVDVAQAIGDASGVMMEGEAAALLGELALRERLVELGADREQLDQIPWQGVLSEAFSPGLHPRDWRGRWVDVPGRHEFGYEDLDKALNEWFQPAQLEAARETHPRSGFDVKVGLERRVAPPPEGTREGPAVFNVYDHGQLSDPAGKQMLRALRPVRQEPMQHVYRAVSEAEWEAIQRQGFIQSDKRGVIVDWEGTNAGVDPRTAVSYLPMTGDGRILKIRVEPSEGWFTIPHDSYVRTRARVPLDRIEAVSPVIHKDEKTNLSMPGSQRLAPPGAGRHDGLLRPLADLLLPRSTPVTIEEVKDAAKAKAQELRAAGREAEAVDVEGRAREWIAAERKRLEWLDRYAAVKARQRR